MTLSKKLSEKLSHATMFIVAMKHLLTYSNSPNRQMAVSAYTLTND